MIIVQRIKETTDGIFGTLRIEPDVFRCFTVENKEKCIPAGTYDVAFKWSQRFQRMTPHIDVPGRTFIEIHNANYPKQLEGCIAVGDKIDGDAVDNSQSVDVKLEAILKTQTGIKIKIVNIPS